MKAIIILPTYNEKENIGKVIEILEKDILPKIKGFETEILVAEDNSPDDTASVVRELMKKYKNLDINSGEKKGLGAAYVRAMSYAIDKKRADVLVQMDADLQHDPEKIPILLSKISEGYDMAIGTRYSQGGSIPPNWPLKRKIFSIFGNLLVRSILMRFWIHDWTGGFRALRKEVFLKEKGELASYPSYTFQIAFLHKSVRDGFKIAEVPFHFRDRDLGKSKFPALEYITNALKYVLSQRAKELIHSPFLKYAITGFIGYLINAISLEVFKRTLEVHAGLAALMGAELSIVWNFLVNNYWAFAHQKIKSPWKFFLKFIQFNLVSAGSLGIISSVVFIGTHIFGDTFQVRQISLIFAIALFVIPYSYSMYNIFIWKRWNISSLKWLQNLVG